MNRVGKLTQELDAIRAKFALDFADRSALIRTLQFLYRTVIATVPLIACAADECEGRDQYCAEQLSGYYRRHRNEEEDHERWFREDLDASGVEIPLIDWLAAAAAGTQYYAIRHHHPVALLGYLAFLEMNPMPLPMVEMLEEMHGMTLLRTLRIHAESDVKHRSELIQMLESVPDDLWTFVEASAIATAHFWFASNERVRTGSGTITFTE